jgi:hypothetical protein
MLQLVPGYCTQSFHIVQSNIFQDLRYPKPDYLSDKRCLRQSRIDPKAMFARRRLCKKSRLS